MIQNLEKGKQIKTYFPSIAEKIISKAEEAYNGLLILPGTMGNLTNVGIPTKWLENPTGNKEFLYSLNRMNNLKIMAEAYFITEDIKYAIRIRKELENWINTVKSPEINLNDISIFSECTPWRALEVGSRGINSWPLIISALKESQLYDDEIKNLVEASAKEHMDILKTVSPLLWPKANHNHYLIENIGLLSFSILFPELEKNGEYKKHAIKELDRSFFAQVTPSGGQIEGSPSYHNACLYWFSIYAFLAKHNTKNYLPSLEKMFSYSKYSSRNIGGNITIADSHGDDKETLMLPAVALYLYTKDPKYLKEGLALSNNDSLDNVIVNNIFSFENIENFYKLYSVITSSEKERINLPLNSYQKELGQVFLRSGWEKDDLCLALICKSPVQNMHSHMDPGSIDLTVNGKDIIVDPGIYTYKEGEDRYFFKSTKSHSTVQVNKKDAWQYISSWKYGEQRDSHITSFIECKNLEYVTMLIDNYHPVKIIRTVALIDKKYILVLDQTISNEPNLISVNFNINSLNIEKYKNYIITSDSDSNLAIISNSNHIEVTIGYYSKRIDKKEETSIVSFNYPNTSSILASSLIIPFTTIRPKIKEIIIDKIDDYWQISFLNKKFKYKDGVLNDLHS